MIGLRSTTNMSANLPVTIANDIKKLSHDSLRLQRKIEEKKVEVCVLIEKYAIDVSKRQSLLVELNALFDELSDQIEIHYSNFGSMIRRIKSRSESEE